MDAELVDPSLFAGCSMSRGQRVAADLTSVGCFVAVAGLGEEHLEFLIPNVAEAFIEKQPEDLLLVIPGIYGASQDVRRLPKMPFKFRLR